MEHILPRDMMNVILDYLSNDELFTYGLTSKTSLESAEHVWKKRYEQVVKEEKDYLKGKEKKIDESSPLHWYKKYTYKMECIFRNRLEKDINLNVLENMKQKEVIERIFELILENYNFAKKYDSLMLTIKLKLHEFIWSDHEEENEIAHKYYPLLFPKDYEEYFEAEITQEDPDTLESSSELSELFYQ